MAKSNFISSEKQLLKEAVISNLRKRIGQAALAGTLALTPAAHNAGKSIANKGIGAKPFHPLALQEYFNARTGHALGMPSIEAYPTPVLESARLAKARDILHNTPRRPTPLPPADPLETIFPKTNMREYNGALMQYSTAASDAMDAQFLNQLNRNPSGLDIGMETYLRSKFPNRRPALEDSLHSFPDNPPLKKLRSTYKPIK